MRRKIPTTFTVEYDRPDRLARIAERSRLNRSSIVRDALEKELRHHETTFGLSPGDRGNRCEPMSKIIAIAKQKGE